MKEKIGICLHTVSLDKHLIYSNRFKEVDKVREGNTATKHCLGKVPSNTATKHCHQTLPRKCAIKRYHQTLPSNTATKRCHQTLPPNAAIKRCLGKVPSNTATKRCHQTLPSNTATKRCHQTLSSENKCYNKKTATLDCRRHSKKNVYRFIVRVINVIRRLWLTCAHTHSEQVGCE